MDTTEAGLRALMGPGTSYITLAIKDPCEARELAEDLAKNPDRPLLTPVLEHEVHAVVISSDVQPCGCPVEVE